jgi:hypothetical protein
VPSRACSIAECLACSISSQCALCFSFLSSRGITCSLSDARLFQLGAQGPSSPRPGAPMRCRPGSSSARRAPSARSSHGRAPDASRCLPRALRLPGARCPVAQPSRSSLPARLPRSAGYQPLLLARAAFLCSTMAARRRSSFAASCFLRAGHSSKSLPW